ncbi:MAG: ATP-binding protein [Elusimicrobiota bacterium]
MFKTFRFRIIVSCLALVLFSLGLAAWLASGRLQEAAMENLRASLAAEASLIEESLSAAGFDGRPGAGPRRLALRFGALLGHRVTFIAMDGSVLADSGVPGGDPSGMDNHAGRPEVAAALAGSQENATRYSSTLDKGMFYLARPVLVNGRQAGVIRLSVPLSSVEAQLASVRRVVLQASAVAAALSLLLGLWLIQVLSAPFGEIIEASKRFAAGDLGHRARVAGYGELKKLAQTLNSMAEELSRRMGELASRKGELEAVFDNMSEGLILTDASGVIKAMNSAAGRLTGIAPEKGAGGRISDIFGGTGFDEAVAEAIASGRPVSRETSAAFRQRFELGVSAAPVLRGGAAAGCVLVVHDVSELKKAERIRRDFVANVSHELKTPLTAIKGSVETLIGGAVDDREHRGEFLDAVLRQAVRLEDLVDDLLRLSSLESASARPDLSDFPLRGLVEDVHRSLLPAFRGKKIDFRDGVPEDLPVKADRKKLEQALFNLLDNAFKYTPGGGRVSVSAAAEEGLVRVTVSDTGPGIPADSLSRVFERFYRVDKARSRELGGTGLGLAIVKHAVELHGGSVGVESEEGRGSAFWFTLPS